MDINSFDLGDFSILAVFLAFSDFQDCEPRDEISNDQIEYSTRKPKIAILQLEVMAVVMEN